MRHPLRTLAAVSVLALGSYSLPASACPPPTLRMQVAAADQLVLARVVERRQEPPSEDCTCGCYTRERLTLEVVEAWKGSGAGLFEMEMARSETETPPGALLLRLWVDNEGTLRPYAIHEFEDVAHPDVAAVREAFARAIQLAEMGQEPDPAMLRAHIVASLLHPATRFDGVLEADEEFRLDDGEAQALGASLAREQASGDDLAEVSGLLAGRLAPDLRELLVKRLDEAFASEEIAYWADALLELLGAPIEEPDTPFGAATEDWDDARWDREMERWQAQREARWQELRREWPAMRERLISAPTPDARISAESP